MVEPAGQRIPMRARESSLSIHAERCSGSLGRHRKDIRARLAVHQSAQGWRGSRHILAITFTRKAAAEMRERIIRELKSAAAARSEFDKARWNEVRDRLGEIAISTIDAFCLSLLREFPLEGGPGSRVRDGRRDRSASARRGVARSIAAHFRRLAKHELMWPSSWRSSASRARARDWRFYLNGVLSPGARSKVPRARSGRPDGGDRVPPAPRRSGCLAAVPDGLARFLADGPVDHPRYQLIVRDLDRLAYLERAGDARIRGVLDRVGSHFLTAEGKARRSGAIPPYKGERDYPSPEAAKRHRTGVFQVAPHVERVVAAFTRDLNVVLARGIKRMFAIALAQYRKALDDRSVLDFSDVLQRALDLLRQMDEFSQSRFRLESRYHHVLVDEFQDTSRAQWELVSLLIQSWGEGLGLATQPSIFIVGDRKQSIYRVRDAEVAVLKRPADTSMGCGLRGIHGDRSAAASARCRSSSNSATSSSARCRNPVYVPTNSPIRRTDRFPVDAVRIAAVRPRAGGRGRAAPAPRRWHTKSPASSARRPFAIARPACHGRRVPEISPSLPILARASGIRARARGFVAFRHTCPGPRFFRRGRDQGRLGPVTVPRGTSLRPARRGVPAVALRQALRCRAGAPGPPAGGRRDGPRAPDSLASLDRRTGAYWSTCACTLVNGSRGWIACRRQTDRTLLPATAYAYELRGPRRQQAWENLKKIRGLVRRIQNRGVRTLARIADHIDSLTAGDESNASSKHWTP